MLKLFSAEYIENICSLWEFGGSWILNFCKRVLSISSMLLPSRLSLEVLVDPKISDSAWCCEGPLEVCG